MEEGGNVHQESRENHCSQGVEEDLRRLVLRNQAKRGKLPLDFTQSQCNASNGDGISPAADVKKPILLGEPSRVPDSVQMKIKNQGRAPSAGRNGRKDKNGT